MGIVKTQHLAYDYLRYTEDEAHPEKRRAIEDVNLDIIQGAFVAILGHNGSGKSTLAKHMNALLMPSEGTVWIDGDDTKTEEEPWKIRMKAGMVFQNPDNQIIAASVEEDVGFGPENVGVPEKEIWERVEEALTKVGMLSFRTSSPNHLSGGQKQRVAIAGIVAMRPMCIVLDEPTAMLDPVGRREVIEVLHELNQKEGVTIILITHYMEEVTDADRLFVMDKGKLVMQGTPREVFSKVQELREMELDVPQVTLLAWRLKQRGLPLPDGILTAEELAAHLAGILNETPLQPVRSFTKPQQANPEEPILTLDHVTYTYSKDTVYEVNALKDISLSFRKGQFAAVIGHTGSGKSTLIQLLNGLLKPTEGKVLFKGEDICAEGFSLKNLRTKVGLVFQYPENQLFEETVLADVSFGPKNQGLSKEEQTERAKNALAAVGVEERIFESSPFDLSGGQKRRVAIAGVLAMEPDVLILDEPTAGLDPMGRDAILNEAERLNKERGITVILVSHSMEDVARYAERLIVVEDGKIAMDGAPTEVFEEEERLEEMGLSAPQMAHLMHVLRTRGVMTSSGITTPEEAEEEILRFYSGQVC